VYVDSGKIFLRWKFYFSVCVFAAVCGSDWCFGRCFRCFSVTFNVAKRDV